MTQPLKKKALLKKWLLRLINEETPQANDKLAKFDGSFCCLGDLLECSTDPKLYRIEEAIRKDENFYAYSYLGYSASSILPKNFLSNNILVDDQVVEEGTVAVKLPGSAIFSPAVLNDNGVPKRCIAMFLWALAPLGQDMNSRDPVRKAITAYYYSLSEEEHVSDEHRKDLLELFDTVKEDLVDRVQRLA